MDVVSGVRKNVEQKLAVAEIEIPRNINGSWNRPNKNASSSDVIGTQSVRLLSAKNIPAPQLMFKDKINNSRKAWKPRITHKPNALKPLVVALERQQQQQQDEEDEEHGIYCHPYQYELDVFKVPESQLQAKVPISFRPMEESPLVMVETEEDLEGLLRDLRQCKEIAVDLEHHNYRTFLGITCLMQISTRDKDYIVDTLSLRSELHKLNDVFTDPNVLKVLHGAESDVKWLQRDLSLYLVNMFDTHKAARQLGLPILSLAYLLKAHTNFGERFFI